MTEPGPEGSRLGGDEFSTTSGIPVKVAGEVMEREEDGRRVRVGSDTEIDVMISRGSGEGPSTVKSGISGGFGTVAASTSAGEAVSGEKK